MKNKISAQEVLDIRKENKRIIETSPITSHTDRYRAIAAKFKRSEWAVRWICQGREYKDLGGFIENVVHESGNNRSLSHLEASSIRNSFRNNTKTKVSDYAAKYNVSESTIIRLLLGKTYRDVAGPFSTKIEISQRNNNVSNLYVKNTPRSKTLLQLGLSRPKTATTSFVPATDSDAQKILFGPAPVTNISSKTPAKNLSKIDMFIIRASFVAGLSVTDLADRFDTTELRILEVLKQR